MRWFQRVALAAIFATVVVSAHADITGGNGPGPAGAVVSIVPAPTSSAASGIAPVVSASAEASHVLKNAPGNLYDAYVTTGTTPGYLMTFNATTAPSNGAVTPIDCVYAQANTTTALFSAGAPPSVFSTGIVVEFSTTGCFTATSSATAFFHGRVQ